LADGIRARDLVPEAARQGVAIVPGESFFVDPAQGRSFVRLNFTYPAPAALVEGAKRLGRALSALREARALLAQASSPIV
jgi:DNA-binding transcriptional MocR family regulator